MADLSDLQPISQCGLEKADRPRHVRYSAESETTDASPDYYI